MLPAISEPEVSEFLKQRLEDRMSDISLGDKVRDVVSGLEGIATARCLYLNGCDHIGIQPPAKDGKIPPIQWVDVPQVEVVPVRSKSLPRYSSGRVGSGSSRGGPSTGGNPGGHDHPCSEFSDKQDEEI